MGNNVPTQKSRWDDQGVEPHAGEARYQAGEQPIAEYDNWFNKAVVDDIAAIITFLRNLGLTKIYQDLEENKPASGKTTELFIATDTNKIYRGTGSGWQELTVDWSKILNKPSTFPPDLHSHDASEIVSGILAVERIPDLTRSKISDFFASPFWDLIPDKPTAFPPKAHQHGDADLLGIDWSKILNKPGSFPSALSKITIDSDKNWQGYKIYNVNCKDYVLSDEAYFVAWSDSSHYTGSTSYTKIGQMILPSDFPPDTTIRIVFKAGVLYANTEGNTGNVQLRKNGTVIAEYTVTADSSSPAKYTKDVVANPNDKFEIYAKANTSGKPIYIKYFAIHGTCRVGKYAITK